MKGLTKRCGVAVTPFGTQTAQSAWKRYPLFFVSVASKGFGYTVSLLFATLAGRSISVAVKGLRGTGRPEVES